MDIKTKRRNQYRAKHGIPLDAPLHVAGRRRGPRPRKALMKITVTLSPEALAELDRRAGETRTRGDIITNLLGK
jgi:hypothetical protein